MPNGVSEASIAAFLETNYGPSKLESMAFKDAPITAMLPKDESAGGDSWAVRVDHTNNRAVAKTFSDADTLANTANFAGTKFLFDYTTMYAVAKIDNLAIERARGGGLAVVDPLQRSIKGAMEALGDIAETAMLASGYGEQGQVAAISTNTITLLDAGDAIEKIEQGDVHCFSQSLAGHVLRGTGGGAAQYLTVSKVDRSNGIITYTANVSTVTGGGGVVAVNDFIFLKSFRDDSATPGRGWHGISAWCPDTAPQTGDSFGSKDRSVDPDRLAGWRYLATAGQSRKSALIGAVMRGARFGMKPDIGVAGFDIVEDLVKELSNDVRYVDLKSTNATVGFRGIEIQTPKGPVTIIGHAKQSNKRCHFIQRDTWKIASVNGALIRPTLRNGKMLDDNGSDGLAIRYRIFGQMGCYEPFKNGVCAFP